MDRILLGSGIAEGHMLQLQFVGRGFRNILAVVKLERLRVFQILPDRADINAVLMKSGHIPQDAHDPGREGRHCREI